jgi:predicted kinase
MSRRGRYRAAPRAGGRGEAPSPGSNDVRGWSCTGTRRRPIWAKLWPMAKPTLAVVSGPAGSGKTTLAHALAEAIGCPVVCRDEIKEGMVHAFGAGFEAAPGDPLTRRTLDVFFQALRLFLEAEVTVVAEAAFQDQVWRAHVGALADLGRLRVVRCRTDAAVARQRVANRPRRLAHADASVLDHALYYDDFVPISLPVPTIDIDTSDGHVPSLNDVLAFVSTN